MTNVFSSPGWGVTYSSQGQECMVSACYLSSRALDIHIEQNVKVHNIVEENNNDVKYFPQFHCKHSSSRSVKSNKDNALKFGHFTLLVPY